MKVCKKCGRVFDRGRWRKPKGNEIARAEAMNEVEYVICEDCAKREGSHEAVLQVRGRFEREEIEKIIIKELEKSEKKGEVEKVFEKGGDYYFTSKSMARVVAKKLKEMGAETKESSKLFKFDRMRSLPLTRLTISVNFRVKPGDVIESRGSLYLVEKVRGGWVWTKEGRKFRINEVKVVDSSVEDGFVISQNPPVVFLPKTNETIEVDEVPLREEVKVIRARGRMWII